MTFRTGLIAAALAAGLASPALAQGDAEAGERVFNKCKACHMVGEDATNRVGPELNNVVGQEIMTNDEFSYSDIFNELQADGFTWTEENLAAYLADPKEVAPGGKMTFAGLRKEEEIADVIAYLNTFGEGS